LHCNRQQPLTVAPRRAGQRRAARQRTHGRRAVRDRRARERGRRLPSDGHCHQQTRARTRRRLAQERRAGCACRDGAGQRREDEQRGAAGGALVRDDEGRGGRAERAEVWGGAAAWAQARKYMQVPRRLTRAVDQEQVATSPPFQALTRAVDQEQVAAARVHEARDRGEHGHDRHGHDDGRGVRDRRGSKDGRPLAADSHLHRVREGGQWTGKSGGTLRNAPSLRFEPGSAAARRRQPPSCR